MRSPRSFTSAPREVAVAMAVEAGVVEVAGAAAVGREHEPRT